MIIMVTVWYPYDKGVEVGNLAAETLKKNPYPPYTKLLAIVGKPTKEGMEAIDIVRVEKDKILEASAFLSNREVEIASVVEGYRFELDIWMESIENYELQGLEMPEPYKSMFA
jgi:hypothetical protein